MCHERPPLLSPVLTESVSAWRMPIETDHAVGTSASADDVASASDRFFGVGRGPGADRAAGLDISDSPRWYRNDSWTSRCWQICCVVLDRVVAELDSLMGRIGVRFARSEPRARPGTVSARILDH